MANNPIPKEETPAPDSQRKSNPVEWLALIVIVKLLVIVVLFAKLLKTMCHWS